MSAFRRLLIQEMRLNGSSASKYVAAQWMGQRQNGAQIAHSSRRGSASHMVGVNRRRAERLHSNKEEDIISFHFSPL